MPTNESLIGWTAWPWAGVIEWSPFAYDSIRAWQWLGLARACPGPGPWGWARPGRHCPLGHCSSCTVSVFDKVPHRRLNYKLDWYGIRGNTREWILDFLSGRSQRVVLEGASSDSEHVVSGVPQGTVLGPVLFLLYINDLPDVAVHSTARLFADDCIVYRPIRNNDDTILLQNDLNKIAEWEFMWQMQFNIDKCFILRVGRPKHKLVHLYTFHNQNLSETDSAKYLGLTITSDLQWNQHILTI